jgi:glutamyl-tRNA synthetase
MAYKAEGYLPEALLNFLVRLGWSHGDQEIFSVEEMLEHFDPGDINTSASQYNPDKLLWLNAHYIKNTPNDKLAKLLEDFGLFLLSHDKREILLDIFKERCKTLKEMAEQIKEVLETPENYDEKALKKAFKGDAAKILADFAKAVEGAGELHLPTDWHALMERFVAEKEIGFGKIGMPLRVALIGRLGGPDLSDVMSIIGKEETIRRIRRLLDFVETSHAS